jgi:hypothetical protein
MSLLSAQSYADNTSGGNQPSQHKGKQQLSGHRSQKMAEAPYFGEIEKTKIFNLAISFPARNKEKINSLISDIYNPKSSSYKQYLSVEQFTSMFGPTEQNYQAIISYLKSKGLSITTTYSNKMVLDVQGTVETINNAFHVKIHYYKRPDGSTFYGPDDEPSIDIDTPILFIQGLDNFILSKPKLKQTALTQNAKQNTSGQPVASFLGTGPVIYSNPTLIGDDFRTAYAPGVSLNGSGQSVALFELDTYYQNDIDLYKTASGRTNVILNVYTDGLNSSITPDNAIYFPRGVTQEGEVVLDIDMVMCIAPASNIIVYMGLNPISVLTKIATDNSCKQISSSWSYSYPSSAFASFEQILLQEFALQGQSYFVASGDYGALSCDPGWSGDDDLLQTLVGGTELNVSNSSFLSETAWANSTGGILTNTLIPDYQQGIDMSINGGSTTNRNDPDIAAAASGIFYYHNNSSMPDQVEGTSAAAPLWAGFVALVNQQASTIGTGPLGFANPSFYNIAKSSNYNNTFHDITIGNNSSNIITTPVCYNNPSGFNAVQGFDLVTGWGSPAGQSLIDALAGPTPTATPTVFSPVCSTWFTNGSAFANMGGSFTLTTAGLYQSGSIWNVAKINLNQDFNKTFKLYFGSPNGADGIDFVLQRDPRGLTALGGSGNNKGYSGSNAITPSVAFALETYNTNGTLQPLENGNITAMCLNSRYQCPYVFSANVANSTEHTYQIIWTAVDKTLTLFFDGKLISTYHKDLINETFAGNNDVYYGFTAATGLNSNLQYVYEVGCIVPTPTYTLTSSPTPTITFTSTISPTATISPTYTTPTLTPTVTSAVCPSWISNGSAYPSGSGVILTTASAWQAGSTWNSTPIDLNQGFDFTFKTYFGAPCGADGIDFVLQRDPRGTAALGAYASDKGYSGTGAITPSVAFTIETYSLFCTNNGTLQVQENGITANTCSYATSTCPGVFTSNIADSSEHTYRVTWNPSTKYFNLIFDGSTVMTYHRDLINAVFGGNNLVYYGFTAGTGSSSNIQYVYGIGCTNPTATSTATQTFTKTSTPSYTCTATPSLTNTNTPTFTCTPTFSPSYTASIIVTVTETSTTADTETITPTNSITPSLTTTPTWTFTTTPPLCASWITNGNAFTGGVGVTLTTNNTWQASSVWNSSKIDLNQDFNMTFKVYFGSSGGGNGINFVLQNSPQGISAIGGAGTAKGYYGITSSLSLSLDTSFSNGTLQPQINGNSAGVFVLPYTFSTNISDTNEHTWQIVWNSTLKNMTVIFDGVAVISFNNNIVNSIFSGNSNVYYGFTAATGVTSNLQYIYEVGCSLPTATFTNSPSSTATFTASPTSSGTPTLTPSFTSTITTTNTPTSSFTQSITPTITETITGTVTGTNTITASPSLTWTITATNTPTYSITETVTSSITQTITPSQSVTQTTTNTFTMTPSITISKTVTQTATSTNTLSPTNTITATPGNTYTPTSTPTNLNISSDKPLIFPNPSNGNDPFKVYVPLSVLSNVKIQLFTVSFRKISDKTYTNIIPGSTISVTPISDNGHSLSNGTYYLEIVTEHKHWALPILIIH